MMIMKFLKKRSFNYWPIWQNRSIKIMGGLNMLCIFSAARDKFREDHQKQQQAAKQGAKTDTAAKK
ncbi:hypothetical protein [Terribacillus aidingensis]|uniref:hypothetical protein n=1 Tax=Terribacillus aidingensis TaxID=586416 RepID=UPI00344EB16E